MLRDRLTNEELRKKFKSQFELVNYSISLAENMIKSGRGPRVKSDNQNRALNILEEIITGKDQFDEIAAPVEVIAYEKEVIIEENHGKRRKKDAKFSLIKKIGKQ